MWNQNKKNYTITKFNDHNYIKEKYFIERIKANQVEKEELKKSENQKFYFKFSYLENPTLAYLDIIDRINEQYDVENIAFNEK